MLARCAEELYGEQDMPKQAWSVYSRMYVLEAWPAAWNKWDGANDQGRPGSTARRSIGQARAGTKATLRIWKRE